MLRLIHHPMSVGSRFVRLLLGEINAKQDLVEEPFWLRRPEFLAINPGGQVPVLIENDGPALVGCPAIMEYLDEVHAFSRGDYRLMPDNANARAEVRRLVEWWTVKFDQEVIRYFVHEKFIKREIGGGSPESGVLRAARTNMRHHLSYVGYLAETRDWIAGNTLTYADFAAAAALSICDYLGEVSWEQDQHARNWYARLKSRPSFRPLLGETLRGLPPAPSYADLDF